MAALGVVILDSDHPGHVEAIEGLRLLHGGLRRPTRTKVMRWLLQALHQPREEVQVTALDSLSYLMRQAHKRGQMKTLRKIIHEIMLDGAFPRLLSSPSAWVRQRTVELLAMVNLQLYTFQQQLAQLLLSDNDSGVRACIAYHLGQGRVRQAIPALLQALLDTDESVAETAFNSLERVAGPNDAIVVSFRPVYCHLYLFTWHSLSVRASTNRPTNKTTNLRSSSLSCMQLCSCLALHLPLLRWALQQAHWEVFCVRTSSNCARLVALF